ncbi:MAG TPA: DUF5777 family beta-barrel protein [Vicinamibacterales bacterium]|nr:DUF5777 family beta-barrel protein [Vicinamibacterales bacterium]
MTWTRLVIFAAVCALAAPVVASAQQKPPAASTDDDPDRDPNRAQPDFTLVNLPTTLRVPKYKSAFRVTHRFARPLGQGDFSDLAEDLFGLDSGAQIGLEYRFGIMRGTQIGIYRTSNRTIEFFAQYSGLQQKDNGVLGLDVIATMDGTDNFSDSYSPALGVVLSHELGSHGALYFEPIWVNNSNQLPSELTDDNDTFLFGIGGRLRVRPTVYVVGEYIPRIGYSPGVDHLTFGVEKRAGGHVFQINFSNNIGTTPAQIARGGFDNEDWYIGFNISRKFF